MPFSNSHFSVPVQSHVGTLPRRTTLTLALLTAFGAAHGADAWPVNNLITITGKTQTNFESNGNVTKITTATVKNNVGFNSFGKFQVAENKVVNLVVPDNAGTLLNLVTDGPILVNGIVNGLKNGAIGGNIVFAERRAWIIVMVLVLTAFSI